MKYAENVVEINGKTPLGKLNNATESLLVLEDGKPIGVITRADILNFLS